MHINFDCHILLFLLSFLLIKLKCILCKQVPDSVLLLSVKDNHFEYVSEGVCVYSLEDLPDLVQYHSFSFH